MELQGKQLTTDSNNSQGSPNSLSPSIVKLRERGNPEAIS